MSAEKPAEKTFVLLAIVDNDHVPVGQCYKSARPYQSALKAATDGYSDIRLCNKKTGKVHQYEGWVDELPAEEQTDYTRMHGICNRPRVKYQGYYYLV